MELQGASRLIGLLITTSLLVQVSRTQEVAEECPEANGFYADSQQCDRYYECKDGQIFDKLCPDGLVFDENSLQFAKCSFSFSVNCDDRPELQPPQGNGACPRLNGYFPHEDPKVCDKFYFCVDGVANPIACPASLIFDPSKGQCAYSDQVKREGCSGEEVFQFECPHSPGSPHEHPRFPDPNDCQYFYICINGVSPRRNGCTDGLVFNKKSVACERPDKVEDECRTWYNSTFLEGLKDRRPIITKPVAKGRKRVKVIRKNPNASGVNSEPVSRPREPAVAGSPPPAAASTPFSEDRPLRSRNRVRQRPRPAIRVEPQGIPQDQPPSFALSDEDSISQFRRNHGFRNSEGSGGRLTVLQTPNRPLAQLEPSLNNQQSSFEEALPGEEPSSPSQPPRRQRPSFRRRPLNQRRPQASRPQIDEESSEKRQEFNSFAPRF
eukprot:TRINITY_DN786_c0_g1_i1.p1 TRINITY_DN786_c0_g1~~TRINITY_DN786_c0_g1_i1.p1  ORF type:complete len:437 (-),score=56.34 TRINITY_DN786_c0_g1_i1:94-1404(-)